MTREKKSRKVPALKSAPRAPKKSRAEIDQLSREQKRLKKRKGLRSGSRQNVAEQGQQNEGRAVKDPRIGSKKPVPLMVEFVNRQPKKSAVAAAPAKPKLTPAEELAMLENDERLHLLLDRVDAGESLSSEEQSYVDNALDRVDELMQILGLTDEDESAEQDSQAPGNSPEDLWERFNNSDPKAF